MVDEMVYVDNVDVINSAHAERLFRRLYGIECALIPVSSKEDLEAGRLDNGR